MIRRISVPPFEALDPLLPRRAGSDPETREIVAGILQAVLDRGDEAVREFGRRFDGVDLEPSKWELDPAEWQGALSRIAPGLSRNSRNTASTSGCPPRPVVSFEPAARETRSPSSASSAATGTKAGAPSLAVAHAARAWKSRSSSLPQGKVRRRNGAMRSASSKSKATKSHRIFSDSNRWK